MSAGNIGQVEQRSGDTADGLASRSTLTVIDNRTGERFELPIDDGAVRSSELGRQAGGLALQWGALHPCSRSGALNRAFSRYPRGESADRTVALRAGKELERNDSTISEVRT